jgi:hypothetical protein
VLSHLDFAPDTPSLAVPSGDMTGFRTRLLDMFPTKKQAIRLWFWTMRRFGRQIAHFANLRTAPPLQHGVGLFLFPLTAPLLMLASI